MPTYKTYEDIKNAISAFNKKALDAGLDFKVYTSDKYALFIQASFDFSYYVNVNIECQQVLYTNIDGNAYWTDAWHSDQMMLLNEEDLAYVMDFKDMEPEAEKTYFGIVFNIIGFENYYIKGLVVCEQLYIHWIYPEEQ